MIPLPWASIAIYASCAIGGGIAGWKACSILKESEIAHLEAAYADHAREAAEAYSTKVAEYRSLEQRMRDEQKKSEQFAQDQLDKVQADLVKSRSSAVGLRSQFGAFVAESTRAAEEARTERERAIARAAADVQRRVLERIDDAAGELAEFADRSRVAHAACIREYSLGQ